MPALPRGQGRWRSRTRPTPSYIRKCGLAVLYLTIYELGSRAACAVVGDQQVGTVLLSLFDMHLGARATYYYVRMLSPDCGRRSDNERRGTAFFVLYFARIIGPPSRVFGRGTRGVDRAGWLAEPDDNDSLLHYTHTRALYRSNQFGAIKRVRDMQTTPPHTTTTTATRVSDVGQTEEKWASPTSGVWKKNPPT